jgi:hypothetical protein
MRAADLTAKQISETLMQIMVRLRYRCTDEEWMAVEEGIRRVKEHERLVQDVLPDLRNRISSS